MRPVYRRQLHGCRFARLGQRGEAQGRDGREEREIKRRKLGYFCQTRGDSDLDARQQNASLRDNLSRRCGTPLAELVNKCSCSCEGHSGLSCDLIRVELSELNGNVAQSRLFRWFNASYLFPDTIVFWGALIWYFSSAWDGVERSLKVGFTCLDMVINPTR